jgi:hypothetical protein
MVICHGSLLRCLVDEMPLLLFFTSAGIFRAFYLNFQKIWSFGKPFHLHSNLLVDNKFLQNFVTILNIDGKFSPASPKENFEVIFKTFTKFNFHILIIENVMDFFGKQMRLCISIQENPSKQIPANFHSKNHPHVTKPKH